MSDTNSQSNRSARKQPMKVMDGKTVPFESVAGIKLELDAASKALVNLGRVRQAADSELTTIDTKVGSTLLMPPGAVSEDQRPVEFDLSAAAESLNRDMEFIEARLSRLPFKLDVLVTEAPNSETGLRFRKENAKWILEYGEITTEMQHDPFDHRGRKIATRSWSWRRIPAISLVKKAEAIKLVPSLIKTMRDEYVLRQKAFSDARQAVAVITALLDAEERAGKEGR